MTEPKIDEEAVAVIRSAKAMARFANYVKAHDQSLTDIEAIILASKIVQALPILFDANSEAFETIIETIEEALLS